MLQKYLFVNTLRLKYFKKTALPGGIEWHLSAIRTLK
jgi:hypothetical protein